jgi:hypothetical protein
MIKTIRANIQLLDLLFVGAIAWTAFNFYYLWVAAFQMSYLRAVVSFMQDRPYVFRVLVPLLSRLLSALSGIDPIWCLMFVIVCSAIGLYFSFKYLYLVFYDPKYAAIIAFIGCELYFLLIAIVAQVYDIATGVFFCLSLAFLARGRYKAYFLLFPLATLNRETTFLLLFFFAVHFLRRMPLAHYATALVYQGITYIMIKVGMEITFAERGGQSFIWWPEFVLPEYGVDLLRTAAYAIVFLLFVGLVIYRWKEKPEFLRSAFVVLGPCVLILHLLIGYPYEVRVFAEAFPPAYLLVVFMQVFPRTLGADRSMKTTDFTRLPTLRSLPNTISKNLGNHH